jgi:hypothetical protein
MTTVSLSVPAGRLYETPDTLGLASMTAELLEQGTQSLTRPRSSRSSTAWALR